ncbi:MAG: hypothetical protein ACTSVX_05935 [Promethearchaeota archaeon]
MAFGFIFSTLAIICFLQRCWYFVIVFHSSILGHSGEKHESWKWDFGGQHYFEFLVNIFFPKVSILF